MKKTIYPDITYLIGKTPLVLLKKFSQPGWAQIAAKLEYLNPSGSVKDRAVLNMICDAEKRGFLKTSSCIIEPTSGNTGLSLAMICSTKGYRLILTMPESIPDYKIGQLQSYGAEVITTPAAEGMKGAIRKAEELLDKMPDTFMLGQFTNPSNPEAHEKTTAVEIWENTGGHVDAVIAGVGTGGTITGLARGLRKKKKEILIIGVEPAGSPIITGGSAGKHTIPGIGAGFVPSVFKEDLLDEVITVGDQDAIDTVKKLQIAEGIPAGISSGAAAWAALEVAKRPENREKLLVVIFADSSEKYITTGLLT